MDVFVLLGGMELIAVMFVRRTFLVVIAHSNAFVKTSPNVIQSLENVTAFLDLKEKFVTKVGHNLDTFLSLIKSSMTVN